MSYFDKLIALHDSQRHAQRAHDKRRRAFEIELIEHIDHDERELDDMRDAHARYSIAH